MPPEPTSNRHLRDEAPRGLPSRWARALGRQLPELVDAPCQRCPQDLLLTPPNCHLQLANSSWKQNVGAPHPGRARRERLPSALAPAPAAFLKVPGCSPLVSWAGIGSCALLSANYGGCGITLGSLSDRCGEGVGHQLKQVTWDGGEWPLGSASRPWEPGDEGTTVSEGTVGPQGPKWGRTQHFLPLLHPAPLGGPLPDRLPLLVCPPCRAEAEFLADGEETEEKEVAHCPPLTQLPRLWAPRLSWGPCRGPCLSHGPWEWPPLRPFPWTPG